MLPSVYASVRSSNTVNLPKSNYNFNRTRPFLLLGFWGFGVLGFWVLD